jgi:Kef-type K+ transport system membrane component KefB
LLERRKKESSGFGDGNGSWNDFISSMEHNFEDPLAILLAQIVMIIPWPVFLAGFSKIRQPTIMVKLAGIVLGPLIIGMYFPDFSAALFPVESLGNLKFLSQIGLILFMFVIGMELDIKVLKTKPVKQLL